MAVSDDLTNLNTVLTAVVVPVGSQPIRRIYVQPTEKQVTTAELPCFLILWRTPEKTQMATFGTIWETRRYDVLFHYKPTGQGTIFDSMTDIQAYIAPTLNAFYAHIALFSTVMGQYPIQCSLPKELSPSWDNTKYLGFELSVTVVAQRAIAFGL